MGYHLEAIVADATRLASMTDRWRAGVVVPLADQLGLIPMTDELFDAVSDGGHARPLGFHKLPSGFERELASWSVGGPIAYIEAEYFGGAGTQQAVLWSQGRVVLGPSTSDTGGPAPTTSPISQVLARLGIDRGDHPDEFAAAGLDSHRRTEDWA